MTFLLSVIIVGLGLVVIGFAIRIAWQVICIIAGALLVIFFAPVLIPIAILCFGLPALKNKINKKKNAQMQQNPRLHKKVTRSVV